MGSGDNVSIRDAQGAVKWFDARKGYGFIVGPEGNDVFAHYTVIEGGGFRIMKDGWVVTYDAVLSPTGWRATRVVLPPGALTELPQARRAPTDHHAGTKPPDPKQPEIVVRKLGPSQRASDEPPAAPSGG